MNRRPARGSPPPELATFLAGEEVKENMVQHNNKNPQSCTRATDENCELLSAQKKMGRQEVEWQHVRSTNNVSPV